MDIVERIDKFQSTSSVWRETAKHEQMLDEWVISIHALRAEGDPQGHTRRIHHDYFNPRPPCGGRHAAHGIERTDEEFQSTPSVRRATIRLKGGYLE